MAGIASQGQLADHIAAILDVNPSAPAIEFEGKWITWGPLRRLCDDLDRLLDELRCGEGTPVGVLLRNRPEHVAAVLAVLATRRCVVTMNALQGDERLCAEISELSLPVIVADTADWTRPGLASAAVDAGTTAVHLEAPIPKLGKVVRAAGARAETRQGVAFELLTSGTTGPPKRIPLLYRNLERALLSAKEYETKSQSPRSDLLRTSVAIVHSPLVHVSGIWRLLEAITAGRRLALSERFTVDGWRDLVVRHRPASSSLVPAAMRMVLDAAVPVNDLSSLRAIVSGTAPLDPALAEEFERRYDIPVLAVYGATEFAGGVAGWTRKDRLAHRVDKRGSVGRAHAGVLLRVVDSGGDELPPGKHGTLEVCSPQVRGDEWVRTTDLASIDADGFLFIHGRADDVIIRGGFKVHPADVESVLERHPAVAIACVVGMADARLGAVPVAAVELWPYASATPEELRMHASAQLVGYQVPERVEVVQTLPRTSSLKASRHLTRQLLTERAKETA